MSAIVDAFERLRRDSPARSLVHLPSAGRTLTTADLQDARLRIDRLLDSQGIGAGHILVSMCGNRPGFLALLLAAWSRGAVVMPADEDTRAEDLDALADRFGAAAVVLARARVQTPSLDVDDSLALVPRTRESWHEHRGLGLLKLTSGSSGMPKAVAVPDAALVHDTEHIIEAMDIAPGDTQIAAIPLSHAYGFGNLVLPLFMQGTAIVLREAFVPQAVVADANRFAARVMPGVPFMFQHFAAHPPEDGWPASLQRLISAGAMLSPDVIRAFHDRFGIKLHSFYGATETGGIAFDHADAVDDVPAVGWAMPGVTIEFCDDEGVPEGYGRVRVHSNAVAHGYLEAEAAAEFGGQFLTGDYGSQLRDGRLLLAGRVSTFINVAGRKVQPGEIEQELRRLSGVVDVRVLSVADALRGEQVGAVVAGAGLSASEVRRWCAERLAAHKVPRVIVIVPDLPRTHRGKVDERALRSLIESGRA